MSIDTVKNQVENELSKLIGERIRLFRRAAFMLNVCFGSDVAHRSLTGARQNINISTEPRFNLHIHSSWRLLQDDEICLGQSDMFNRMAGFKTTEKDDMMYVEDAVFDEFSKELNQNFEMKRINIIKVEANELGDLKICMEDNYCLEVFVDTCGNNESWRFFDINEEKEHFVVFEED